MLVDDVEKLWKPRIERRRNRYDNMLCVCVRDRECVWMCTAHGENYDNEYNHGSEDNVKKKTTTNIVQQPPIVKFDFWRGNYLKTRLTKAFSSRVCVYIGSVDFTMFIRHGDFNLFSGWYVTAVMLDPWSAVSFVVSSGKIHTVHQAGIRSLSIPPYDAIPHTTSEYWEKSLKLISWLSWWLMAND